MSTSQPINLFIPIIFIVINISYCQTLDTSQVANNIKTEYKFEKDIAPNRPIAQTVVGIALVSQAVAICIVGCFSLSESSDGGFMSSLNRDLGLVLIGSGVIYSIPGVILLTTATKKWKIYNKWEMENKSVLVGLRIAI